MELSKNMEAVFLTAVFALTCATAFASNDDAVINAVPAVQASAPTTPMMTVVITGKRTRAAQ